QAACGLSDVDARRLGLCYTIYVEPPDSILVSDGDVVPRAGLDDRCGCQDVQIVQSRHETVVRINPEAPIPIVGRWTLHDHCLELVPWLRVDPSHEGKLGCGREIETPSERNRYIIVYAVEAERSVDLASDELHSVQERSVA